jgi:hypothetical protein
MVPVPQPTGSRYAITAADSGSRGAFEMSRYQTDVRGK